MASPCELDAHDSTMTTRTVVAVQLMVVLAVGTLEACRAPTAVETVTVSIAAGELYQYPTVGGDEEGARIVTQARHYATSEIRRNAATNWVATYVYQPAAGFTGSDGVEIEILTGSDGASPPTKTQRVAIQFDVH